ncbi:ATPase family AAA domain-containing protein 2 [Gracilariopsis chorda]|uniref:ATPase family AAA domain-containing protein 2 n=1 Tax=Gracilariopsis chorda TaxID=448386 RepID=A0A2V3IT44_9FLOR|nr:ATPase family AAA domain-containing protein 2 [Gracilariopsis chorda]|eukprot:PXF45293.1 ATPase family AAA domain-containing protein 2 [Gracilariopsis chorda]
MGADARPPRTCKARTIERLSLQCDEDAHERDSDSNDFMHPTARTAARRRSKRLVRDDDDDDDNDNQPLGTGTFQISHSPISHLAPNGNTVVQDDATLHSHSSDEHDIIVAESDKEAETVIPPDTKSALHHSASEDAYELGADDEEDDDQADADFPGTTPKKSLPLRLRVSSQPTTFITKSGRLSKPPQSVTPQLGTVPHRVKSASDQQYASAYRGRLRSRTRRLGSYAADRDDIHDPYLKQEPHLLPVSSKRKGTRLVTNQELETRRLTRYNSRRNAQPNDAPIATSPYRTRNRLRREANGRTRSSRQRSNRHDLDKDDSEEADADGDFHTPPEEESDSYEEHELDRGAIENSDTELIGTSTRSGMQRSRKRQPQRSITRSRKRARTRDEREQNSMARETRKSYRPRRDSMRPMDFYLDNGISSDDNESSDDSAPLPRRPRSTRAAANRAGDAIANDISKLDFLNNPMALIDPGKPARPKRIDRFNHRRNRLAPTRPDPFASDADDALGAVPPSIEPIQVDLDLSWDDIGGLDHHVRALKEMVFLPLLYPEVFDKFHMEPPKGVLFYGPPGTGKTLCARALAASCGADPEISQETAANTSSHPNPQPTKEDKMKASNSPSPTRQNGTIVDEVIDGSGFDKMGMSQLNDKQLTSGTPTTSGQNDLGAKIVAQKSGDSDVVMKDHDSSQKEPATPSPPSVTSKPVKKKKPRVAFFMRNGADCLSKWVGEAERQLRLTFEAAKKHQPSIIFFDEIDGLAPVRSSRQDQIHSSIVSTLLSLMDGLDARGKIVVIGATNRVDAIDPALRRPGRFDRELIFTLPNMEARRRILGIHTAKWKPPPNRNILNAVAKIAVGYCGADLKALCSEAAIRALRRRYPQIYNSHDKLQIDVNEVRVATKDFVAAMKEIIPASHRSARTYARPISERLRAILSHPLQSCIYTLQRIFAPGLSSQANGTKSSLLADADGDVSSSSDEEGDILNIEALQDKIAIAGKERSSSARSTLTRYHILRPRLLICGQQGLGQSELGPALLHHCEGCPVHAIDYPSLQSDGGARSCEESLISAFREAARSVPSILYLPHLHMWWETASESLRTTLVIALKDIPSDLPLLVLATAERRLESLPQEVTELFGDVVELSAPSEQHRTALFEPIIREVMAKPRRTERAAKIRKRRRATEVLAKAPPPPPRELSGEEKLQKLQMEDRYIRALRMEMRGFVERLLRDRRFKAFWNPVDVNSAPDYYEIIKEPMDISKIAAFVDMGRYPTVLAMVRDFNVMVQNAIQYNPPNTESGAMILRRAHGLIDIVHAWTDNLDPTLVETCNRIVAERIERAEQEKRAAEAKLNSNANAGGGDGIEVKTDNAPVAGDRVAGPQAVVNGEKVGEEPMAIGNSVEGQSWRWRWRTGPYGHCIKMKKVVVIVINMLRRTGGKLGRCNNCLSTCRQG